MTELPPDGKEHDGLPRHTTPTWEVEMLISGAAVFAMLQLPGWLDRRLLALLPRFDAQWIEILTMAYIYLKSAAILLVLTFAVHLTLRAFWIALVGVHSVYPDGIRWPVLRRGPIQEDSERRRYGSRATAIDRADNRATLVFATGVMLAIRLLQLCLFIALVFVIVTAAASLFHLRAHLQLLLASVTALVLLPRLLIPALDEQFGAGLDKDSLPRRMLMSLFGFYANLGLARSHVLAVIESHSGKRLLNLLTLAVFAPLLMFVVVNMRTLRSPERMGNYALFPAAVAGHRVINDAYYDNLRNPVRDAAVPYVQNEVITGPYVRLVVPYLPVSDNPALLRGCAGALTLSDRRTRDDALLRCLTALHPVSLDGKPLSSLRYDVGSDPRTNRPALVTMIDVRTLRPGRHVLRVGRVSASADANDTGHARHYVIPFWR